MHVVLDFTPAPAHSTGQHIMDHVILGRLKGKTVVLPCHALSFLVEADWIVSLSKGRIVEQGTYRGLLSAGGDFAQLMEEYVSVKNDEAGTTVASVTPVTQSSNGTDEVSKVAEKTKGVELKSPKDGKLMTVRVARPLCPAPPSTDC
eukprot:SAG31_NODE_68_length_28153_cov_23.647717_24_plen_147_part_00